MIKFLPCLLVLIYMVVLYLNFSSAFGAVVKNHAINIAASSVLCEILLFLYCDIVYYGIKV